MHNRTQSMIGSFEYEALNKCKRQMTTDNQPVHSSIHRFIQFVAIDYELVMK